MKNIAVLLLIVVGLVSCQSTPQEEPPAVSAAVAETPEPAPVPEPTPEPVTPPVEAAPDQIEISRDGFSPLAAPPNHTLTVSIRWGDPSQLTEWALAFVGDSGEAVRTFRGTDALPFVDWDGKTDAGTLAPQGRYQAVLQTVAAGTMVERARSLAFLLDIVPPTGSITVTPQPFVLGPADVLVQPPSVMEIRLTLVSGAAPWTTWRLAVLHPDGRRFRDFINEDHRDNRIVWDGRAINNAQLEAGVTYRLEAEVYDVYGNPGRIMGSLQVDARPVEVVVAEAPPVEAPATVAAPPVPAPAPPPQTTTVSVTLDGRLLAELPLYFPPYSSNLEAVTGERKVSNDAALARLVELLQEAAGTQVQVVGHANQVLYHDPVKAEYEQRETLIPLSLARAQAVKKALSDAGLDGASLTPTGVGAADPVAPFSDPVNRWKNRRVVLTLDGI